MEERSLIRGGITLLSGVDPVRRAECLADAVIVKDKTLYFCPSPLYGYGLERLLTRLEKDAPNSAVLCIEADPELYELTMKNIPLGIINNEKLRITNICDSGKLCGFVSETWGLQFRRIETIKFTGGWQIFPELYNSLADILQREIASGWSNAMTLAKLGRLYIHNTFRNLSLIPDFPFVTDLSFGNEPVLVLGAGPSLDETLNHLCRTYSSRKHPFKIICVDTCLPALKDRDIKPDLVVILESQHWNLRDFIGCRGWKVPLAMDISALPISWEMLAGEKYLFFTPWTELKIFKRLSQAELLPAEFPPLGSVGITAVEITRHLTGGKIICAGLDFSFTHDKYHARSTPGHREKLNTQNRINGFFNTAVYDTAVSKTISKSGISVLTSPILQNYRRLFEQEFSSDPLLKTRMFDITGSGLPLGLTTISIEEAFRILSEGTGRQTSRATHSDVTGENYNEVLKEKLTTFLQAETGRLISLKKILTGDMAADQEQLACLIDECDYLWKHFPGYSRGQNVKDTKGCFEISFLKRLRMEIDPVLALFAGYHWRGEKPSGTSTFIVSPLCSNT